MTTSGILLRRRQDLAERSQGNIPHLDRGYSKIFGEIWGQVGPGNPYARQVAALRRALHAAVSEKEVKELGRALLDKAKKGDVPACKLLLSYLLGKPVAVNRDLVSHTKARVSNEEAIRAVREIYGLDLEEHQ